MNKIIRYGTIFFFVLLVLHSWAQKDIYKAYDIYRNPFRVVINKMALTTTWGYGFSSDKTDRIDARSVPMNVSLHVKWSNFRIGVGTLYKSIFRQHPVSKFIHVYALVGYKIYSYRDYGLVLDYRLGTYVWVQERNPNPLQVPTHFDKTNHELGVGIERNISEYLRIIARTDFRFAFMEGTGTIDNNSLNTNPIKPIAYSLQVGVSYNFPDTPRSPIKNDKTRVKHLYRNSKKQRFEEVRGQPITRKQNPKIGQYYKKNKKSLEKIKIKKNN